MKVTDCGVGLDLLYVCLDFDFPSRIQLPYHMYDRIRLLQCHHILPVLLLNFCDDITAMKQVIAGYMDNELELEFNWKI